VTWSNVAASVLQVTTLIVGGPGGGLFVYSGTPATGNLIGSWAGAAGTDAFGNAYPAGLNVAGGNLAAFAGPTGSTTILTADVFADAFARFIVNADGTLGWGPGTTPTDTNLFRAGAGDLKTGGQLHTGGNLTVLGTLLTLATAGAKFAVKEGANSGMGLAVLAGGTVVVPTNAVNANSRIQLTTQVPGGTVGSPYVSARSTGVSFTITSTSAADTSSVAWLIIDPAP
jgi:hypothetical protein